MNTYLPARGPFGKLVRFMCGLGIAVVAVALAGMASGSLLFASLLFLVLGAVLAFEALWSHHKSDERRRIILETAMDGFLLIDSLGRVLEVNATYCRMSGYSQKELLGMQVAKLDVSAGAGGISAHIAGIMALGEDRFDARHRRKNGSVFDVEVSAQHLVTNHGRIVVFVRDIADRKRAETIQQLHQAVMKTVSEGVFIIGMEDHIIKWANRRQEELFGYGPREMEGMRLDKVNAPRPASSTEMRPLIVEALRGSGMWRGEVENIRKDGTRFWCNSHVSVFDHPEFGSVMVSANADITDLKQVEQYVRELAVEKAAAETARQKNIEIAASYQELQRSQGLLIQAGKMAAVGTLSAGVAHELNNPLTGILGIARSYMTYKDPKEREYSDMQQVVHAGERMAQIIKGLLIFSMPTKGEKRSVDCGALIETVLGFAQRIMQGRDVAVKKDLEKNLPLVEVDENRLEQVIFNIINNAFDAMQNKGTLMIVTRRILADGNDFVEMEFSDSGCGIRKEDLPRIFDPFFTTKRPGKGTGLGLAVSYSIIRECGGEISVESPPAGQASGASFKVRIPAAGKARGDKKQAGG